MFYKGIILDLDNTIYDYDKCNHCANNYMYDYINQHFNIKQTIIKEKYLSINESLKFELNDTASSHNRNIYIKQLCEALKIELTHVKTINDLYWKTFYDNIKLFDFVIEFLEFNKNLNIKIGILTDYEVEYQIEKLNKLHILKYIDVLITSEEVGIEKPSKQMFFTILDKLKLNKDEVLMIGDNFKKDIMGAVNIGIFPLYYNLKHENDYTYEPNHIIFNNYKALLDKFNSIKNELCYFENINKRYGERLDYTQAGGGNTSFKMDDLMFIKSSGIKLSDIKTNNGYTIVNNKSLYNDVSNNIKNNIEDYKYILNSKPSIETYMHSFLKKYVIHLHIAFLNTILVKNDARNILNKMYKNISEKILIIDYISPGYSLSLEIHKSYKNEDIIFLLNHGIILTSNNYKSINDNLNELSMLFCKYFDENNEFNKPECINYNINNTISNIIENISHSKTITLLSENANIKNLLTNHYEIFDLNIIFPDLLVYCGEKILFIEEIKEVHFIEYITRFNYAPKLIIHKKNLYICSGTINKCYEIENVLLSYLQIVNNNENVKSLSKEEIYYLNNWDAEKYRQSLEN
jgi:putative hydrolase of the HAD superfamily